MGIASVTLVMRGYYKFSTAQIAAVMNHLLASPRVMVEDRDGIVQALSQCEAGLALADALHHASYRTCGSGASFEHRQFARRARRMGLSPRVVLPASFIDRTLAPASVRQAGTSCRSTAEKDFNSSNRGGAKS